MTSHETCSEHSVPDKHLMVRFPYCFHPHCLSDCPNIVLFVSPVSTSAPPTRPDWPYLGRRSRSQTTLLFHTMTTLIKILERRRRLVRSVKNRIRKKSPRVIFNAACDCRESSKFAAGTSCFGTLLPRRTTLNAVVHGAIALFRPVHPPCSLLQSSPHPYAYLR